MKPLFIKKICLLICLMSQTSYAAHGIMKVLCVFDELSACENDVLFDHMNYLRSQGHEVEDCFFVNDDTIKLRGSLYRGDELLAAGMRKYDIFFCENGLVGKKCVTLKKKINARAKIVTCFQGYDVSDKEVMDNSFYRDLFEQGDLFLPASEYVKYRLEILGLRDDKRVTTFLWGIDCKKYAFRLRGFNEKLAATIISFEDPRYADSSDCVVTAVEEVRKSYPNVNLKIVSHGDLRKKSKKFMDKSRINKNITLVERLPNRAEVKELHEAYCFVYNSVTCRQGSQCGIPDMVKKAMAVGLPVISAHHGGILELINENETGLLVPERDVKFLANRIKHLITHPDKLPLLVFNARNVILSKCNSEQTHLDLERLLLALL
jgi:colanic acid/amylovoran biosynthesis glycosyltransferase